MAISRQTLNRDGGSRDEVASFNARLMSMAQAHDLLTHSDWQRADLVDLVQQVLSPFPQERFEIDGCPVLLPQKAVVSFSLAIHELATNAAKYGALSGLNGIVSISWTYDATSRRLLFTWAERDGPPVEPPTRRGFGSRLLQRLLAAELNGRSTINYDPTGVVCKIEALLIADT